MIIASVVLIAVAFFTPAWFRTIFIREITRMNLREPVSCITLYLQNGSCLNIIECPVNYAFHIGDNNVCNNISRFHNMFGNKMVYGRLFKLLTLRGKIPLVILYEKLNVKGIENLYAEKIFF